MVRSRTLAIVVGVGTLAASTVAGLRHRRRSAQERSSPGGILMPNAASYDVHSRVLLGSLYRGIAGDVAKVAGNKARILEVGCGPGHFRSYSRADTVWP
jgi:hypothetical protein